MNGSEGKLSGNSRHMNWDTRLEHLPFMLLPKCTMCRVLIELDRSRSVLGFKLDNVRMKRQLGYLGRIQGCVSSTDVWARSGKFRSIWLHQSHPEASLDQCNHVMQVGDPCTLSSIELTDQVEDEARVQMHVATDVTSSSPSIFTGSTSLGICAPEHGGAVYDMGWCLVVILWEQVKLETIGSGECKFWELCNDGELTQIRNVVCLFHENIGVLRQGVG